MTTFKRTVARSIALSILLWRDATPGCKFPPLKELVSIELIRLLSDPGISRTVPGYTAAMETGGVTTLLRTTPWDLDPRDLLTTCEAALSEESKSMVMALVEDKGHKDVVLDMIVYRRKPQTNDSTCIATITQGVCDVLGLLSEDDALQVSTAYEDVYKEIVRV